MTTGPYTMRDLVSLTGVKARTIRYWTEKGAIPPYLGESSRYATYTQAHVDAIRRVLRDVRDGRITLRDIAYQTGYRPPDDGDTGDETDVRPLAQDVAEAAGTNATKVAVIFACLHRNYRVPPPLLDQLAAALGCPR